MLMKKQKLGTNVRLQRSAALPLGPILIFCLAIGLHMGKAAEPDLSKLPPALDKKGITFEKDIRPILAKNCIRCHGEKNPKGKLRLDSLEAALKGGEDGKVIEVGNGAKSPIVQFTARLNEDDAMPPTNKGNPLTREQVALLRAWIDQGAK